MGDGNCMFRAIAHQLYGLDKQHLQLRLTLQEVIQKMQNTTNLFG